MTKMINATLLFCQVWFIAITLGIGLVGLVLYEWTDNILLSGALIYGWLIFCCALTFIAKRIPLATKPHRDAAQAR